MADGVANPYVAVAAVLQAAKLGVEHNYELGPAESQDCLGSQDAKDGVGGSLEESLKDLSADSALVEVLGETLVQNHVCIKEVEAQTLSELDQTAIRDYYLHYV